jgi:hypothetical protein
MLYVLPLTLPFALLGLMLAMDRVERPLRQDALGEHLLEFLDSARPDEVETYVQEGFAPALDSYWRRRHPAGSGRTSALHSPQQGTRTAA